MSVSLLTLGRMSQNQILKSDVSTKWMAQFVIGRLFAIVVNVIGHAQTLANRTKPGPSLQVEKWLHLCYLLMFLLSKTA